MHKLRLYTLTLQTRAGRARMYAHACTHLYLNGAFQLLPDVLFVLEEDADVTHDAVHSGSLCDEVLVKVEEFGDGEVEELFIFTTKTGHHLLPLCQT